MYAAGRGESRSCLNVYRESELFLAVPFGSELTFDVSWIHSVEHEEWIESFVADDAGTIRLVSTRFRTFGAGTPDRAPVTSLRDGWVVMSGFDRIVDPYVIRTAEITEHTMHVGDEALPLLPGQYRFIAERRCPGRDRKRR